MVDNITLVLYTTIIYSILLLSLTNLYVLTCSHVFMLTE